MTVCSCVTMVVYIGVKLVLCMSLCCGCDKCCAFYLICTGQVGLGVGS